jgi:hypothetical protein
MSERALQALTNALYDSIEQKTLGELYTLAELCEWTSAYGVSIAPDELARTIRENGGITLRFRGGHSNASVSRENPNREATLHEIGAGQYSLDTEAAVQTGLQRWFHGRGFVAKREVPDREGVIRAICDACSLVHLPDVPTSRNTRCRDLMAHSVDSPAATFHIIELKGRTAVVSDFYDTFGQVFPVDDPTVTRGWTINKVPKHGLCLKHALRFLGEWRQVDPHALMTLVVAVPDFPPVGHDVCQFFDAPTTYYPRQVATFRQFLSQREPADDATFERLLCYLKGRFGLSAMLAEGEAGVRFRFWGYQGLHFVRDFATNRPVTIGPGATRNGGRRERSREASP